MRNHFAVLALLLAFAAHGQHAKRWAQARAQLDAGKVYAAIRTCDRMVSGKTPHTSFRVLRAEGFNRIGNYAQAEKDARTALAVVRGDTVQMAALQIGIAMMESGRPDTARIWLERSLGGHMDAEAQLRLARLDLLQGAQGEALNRLNTVLERQPDLVRALLERGAVHAARNDTAAARRDLDRAVELAPRDPVALNSRGFLVHATRGDHARAIVDYDRAIKMDPNYSFAFNNRGWSLYKLGQVDKGRKNILLAARKRAANPFVFRNLGVIALETGDTATACSHFKQALVLKFEQLHGPEVSELQRKHCTTPAVPPAPSNAPDAPVRPTSPRSNAPRSNAP
jgi:Tfp pilus assembly protein PilF